MNYQKSRTKQNLAFAFAAECQAGARYQFMATQAQIEKLCYIKDTLKLLAKNEMAHAKLFYDYIISNGGDELKIEYNADYPFVQPQIDIGLKEEAEIETDEFERIYPKFAKIAMEEGFKDIAESFNLVAGVEQTHAAMLEHLSEGYKANSLYKSDQPKLYRCSNCGHVEFVKDGWKTCPLCGMDQGYIMIDYNAEITKCAKEQSKASKKEGDEAGKKSEKSTSQKSKK